MAKGKKIKVGELEIRIEPHELGEYFCITDLVKFHENEYAVYNWMKNQNTVEFLAEWEKHYNPGFNLVQMHNIKNQVGLNRFTLSPKQWIEQTGAIGIEARAGRYGGTYAHEDIALEFATWLSPVFKFHVITEYKRLKLEENKRLAQNWQLRRELAKVNYHIHTQAVKAHLIPPELASTGRAGTVYASEADLLNLAVFGVTAKQWREANPESTGNMRDYAEPEQLHVLANLEAHNAEMIARGVEPLERLHRLNEIARREMLVLLEQPAAFLRLKGKTD